MGQLPNQCRNRKNLITLGQLGPVEQVDDLDVIAAREMFFADLFQIGKCRQTPGRLPGHVQAQCPLFSALPFVSALCVRSPVGSVDRSVHGPHPSACVRSCFR